MVSDRRDAGRRGDSAHVGPCLAAACTRVRSPARARASAAGVVMHQPCVMTIILEPWNQRGAKRSLGSWGGALAQPRYKTCRLLAAGWKALACNEQTSRPHRVAGSGELALELAPGWRPTRPGQAGPQGKRAQCSAAYLSGADSSISWAGWASRRPDRVHCRSNQLGRPVPTGCEAFRECPAPPPRSKRAAFRGQLLGQRCNCGRRYSSSNAREHPVSQRC